MSKSKKIVLISVVIVVVLAVVIFSLHFLKKKNKENKTVNVYAVSEVGYEGGYGYEDMLYGSVNSTNEQKVYISSNQKISEIKVTEGQPVKVGDVLLVYDTTAQSLQLNTLATEVELARVAVLVAERELKELKEITPVDETTEAPTTVEPTTQEPTTQAPTTEAPVEIPDSTPLDATDTDASGGETPTTEITTETQTPEEPTTEASTTQAPTTQAPTQDNSDDLTSEEGDGANQEEVTYTKKELNQAIKDKEVEINRLKIAYQMIQISYQIMEVQNATGELVCTCDGVVRTVIDEETAIANNEPIIVVGEVDGYVVDVAIGELALGDVSIGDTVSMMCYDDGMTYEGVITNISEIPYSEDYYGDPSQSYYPMTISVMDAENLMAGMYMEISLGGGMDEAEEALYLSSAFVKYENGGYYVYKEVDGVLKKCQVAVGTVAYGDLEIVGGLSYDDYIAFPHSADAVDGVKTKQESSDKLYY